ncbi:MAG: efflux RND transporter permease subunit [Hyphomicrobiaceae bacterium]
MSTLFYRDARLFALAILMMVAAGASALMTIGRQEDPTITNLFATIVTPFPGADPGRVEALVTEKIEERLREIPEITETSSVSRLGISVVRVELSQRITDTQIEQAWSKIRDALSDAARNFPAGVPRPEFDNDRTGAFTSIMAILPSDGAGNNPAVLRRYARQLQDRLRAVPGTRLVDLYGARTEEITVSLDARLIASLGLSPSDISRAIEQADSKVRAGQVRGRGLDLLIEVAGEIKALDRLRAIPVQQGANGRLVRLADVAKVTRGLREPADSFAIVDGRQGVLVAAKMEDDLQVDTWAKRIAKVEKEFAAALPGGLELRRLFDQAAYTSERLSDVMMNMAAGMAIVISVLFFTLGWRAALVVALVIPLSAIVSVAGLRAMGIPIHQMSVTGLIVALGLLVDAAIVVTDEIRKKLAAGESRLAAVDQSVRRLAAPLLASTVTTVLAFMPMVLLPGPAGDFVGSIALAVITMLIVSFALALTITPALAGWLLPAAAQASSATAPEAPPRGLFAGSLRLAVRFPLTAMLGAAILPIIGFGAFTTLKPQFFPGVDRNQFYIQVKLADGTAISETQAVARKVDAITRREDAVTSISWVVGESAPAFYYNMIADQDGVSSYAEALVTTTSARATEDVLDRLQRQLNASVPEARAIVRGLVQGPPVNAPVEIRVVGPNLDTLRQLGDQIRLLMLDVPGITVARTQVGPGAPKISVDLSEEKVRLAGLDLGNVARQLEAQLEGVTGGSIVEASEELPIRVRVGNAARRSVSSVENIDLVGPNARTVAAEGGYPGIPLTALGAVQIVPSKAAIHRRNGERVNTIQAFVERDLLPEVALRDVRKRITESGLTLPAGYRFEVGGDSDARDETMRNLLGSLGIIVTLTIASIVMTFGSYRLSAVTAVVAVLSIGLSLLALAIFRYPFGIQGVIGVIGSIGVSINAAIIIMTALQANAGAVRGDVDNIVRTVMAQSRHIVSTTVTTFGGFLPLILAGGGFWPPFAMAIGGGVLLSTVVSFYFVPPAFALLARSGRLPSGARSEPEAVAQAA